MYHSREVLSAWWARYWQPLAGMFVFLCMWHVGSILYGPLILPSPSETMTALWRLAMEGVVLPAAARTAGRALGGFLIAGVVGSGLGVLAGLCPWLARALGPVVTMLLGVPPIAWIVLALLWFGTGALTPVFTVVVTTLPITFAVAVEGARTRDTGLEAMARSFNTPSTMLLWDVHLPHILSYLFPGWVTALGLAWKVAVMAELLASTDGIGANMAMARVNLDTADAMAWIVVVVGMLLFVEYGMLEPLQRRMEPWRNRSRLSV